MFVALTAEGERLELLSHAQAATIKAQGSAMYCPGCGARLLIRSGVQMPAHFAHHGATNCHSEPESSAHLRGKLWLRARAIAAGWQAQMEVPVGHGTQRIDVMATQGATKIALEYQCSPLAATRLQERVAGYAALGIIDRWYLGHRYYAGRHRQAARLFARLGATGLYWYFLDSQTGRMWLELERPTAPRLVQVTWPAGHSAKAVAWPNMRRQATQLAQQLRQAHRSASLTLVQTACYARGLNLAGCPWVVHQNWTPRAGWQGNLTLLRVQWLLQFSGKMVSIEANRIFWCRQFEANRLPLVSEADYIAQFVQEWPMILAAAGYLDPVSGGWTWRRLPQWFASIDEKMLAYGKD